MIQRQLLDYSYIDLAYLLLKLFTRNKKINSQYIQTLFHTSRQPFLGLSIRTTWDLILTKFNFQKGSEVLISSITIRNMIDIIHKHELTPVPFDQNLHDLSINYESLHQNITSKTKIILIAHITGAITPLEPIKKIKKKYPHILIIEDCAQGFKTAQDWKEEAWIDVSMISFGTIKTMSCLGGALSFIQNPELADSIRKTYAHYPYIKTSKVLKKIAKGFILKFFSNQYVYTFSYQICRLCHIDFSKIVSQSIKGFPGPKLFRLIRHKLPLPIQSLMIKKIIQGKTHIYTQQKNALFLLKHLKRPEIVIGYQNKNNAFWLFPVQLSNIDHLLDKMKQINVDATINTSHMIKLTKDGIIPLQNTAYIPIHQDVSQKKLLQIATVLNELQ